MLIKYYFSDISCQTCFAYFSTISSVLNSLQSHVFLLPRNADDTTFSIFYFQSLTAGNKMPPTPLESSFSVQCALEPSGFHVTLAYAQRWTAFGFPTICSHKSCRASWNQKFEHKQTSHLQQISVRLCTYIILPSLTLSVWSACFLYRDAGSSIVAWLNTLFALMSRCSQ